MCRMLIRPAPPAGEPGGASATDGPGGAQTPDDLVLVRRARDRIDRDDESSLDVRALAGHLGTSAAHLGRQFRLAFGMSLRSYVKARRIEGPIGGQLVPPHRTAGGHDPALLSR
jgi:AraC-like DNA-binding protein